MTRPPPTAAAYHPQAAHRPQRNERSSFCAISPKASCGKEKQCQPKVKMHSTIACLKKRHYWPCYQAARRAYHERLVTFQPATYFAKPASISPLVCARFGYVCCVNLPWERKFIAVSIDAASWAWSCSCHVATMLFPIYKTV